ncbi:hypothetical protein ES708_12990 [subsurface metagenome]
MGFHESRVEGVCQVIVRPPGLFGKEIHPRREVSHRRMVGRRILGLETRLQVQLRQPIALLPGGDETAPLIQLVGDVKDPVKEFFRRGVLQVQIADLEMDTFPFFRQKERIGRLPDTVVVKAVEVAPELDKPFPDEGIHGVEDLVDRAGG